MASPDWYKEDYSSASLYKAVAVEFLATMLFVFLGCGSIISFTGIPFSVERIAFTFGLAIFVLVEWSGNISGGHINPAVSVGMLVLKKVSPVRCLFYIIAQMAGAIAGAGILYGVTPSSVRATLGTNNINPLLTSGQGLGCEIMLTFILMSVILASTDARNGAGNMAPLAIGLTVTVAHLMGIPFSGASMNPARSLGPAVVTDSFANHWIYWVGPLIGAPLASVVYKYVLMVSPDSRSPVIDNTNALVSAGPKPSGQGQQKPGDLEMN